MILNSIHSDASYHLAGKDRSRACGYFFLGSLPHDSEPIWLNGNIHITCAILKTCRTIRRRGGTWCLISQRTRSEDHLSHFGRNGTPATSDPYTCGQHYYRWHHEQHYQTPTVVCDGDAIFLATQPRSSENIGRKPTSRGRKYGCLPQQSTHCTSLQTRAPILCKYGKFALGPATGAQPKLTARVG